MKDTGQYRIPEKQLEDENRKIDKTTLQKEKQEYQEKQAKQLKDAGEGK